MNVALSRAKSKLLMLGAAGTLQRIEECKRLIELTHNKGWFYCLPRGADTIYQEVLSQYKICTIGSQEISKHKTSPIEKITDRIYTHTGHPLIHEIQCEEKNRE